MTFRLRQKSWAKPVQAAQDAEQEQGIDSSETIRQLLTQEKSINRNETEELDQHNLTHFQRTSDQENLQLYPIESFKYFHYSPALILQHNRRFF